MKSRSHCLPPSDPHDDWVDGSWTVDCSCGVTFDDGEEMVSCDECGVWVHTRCSRFVKGEVSFACHNCKNHNYTSTNTSLNNNNNNTNTSNHNSSSKKLFSDTEETEVAQLLIELPTKTDSHPPPNPFPGPRYRRPPFRLWAEVPLEDKVHVQGAPGGDPAMFQGISSSVFTSDLWRCTGYVPKKFNFQYREFPCWDEDGGVNPASQGADVLFSLSKEIVPSSVLMREFEKKQEGEKVLFGNQLQSWGKKERNKLRVFGSHSSKRRKEELREGKERSWKKKARSDAHRVAAEFMKRGLVSVAAEANKADICEGGGFQIVESDVPSMKADKGKENGVSQLNLGVQPEGMDIDSKSKHVLVIKTSCKDNATDDEPKLKSSSEVCVKVETDEGTTGVSSKFAGSAASHDELGDTLKESVKEEDIRNTVHGLKQPKDESHFQRDLKDGSCPVVIDSKNTRTVIDNLPVPDTGGLPDSNGSISLCSKTHKTDMETDREDGLDAGNSILHASPGTNENSHAVDHLANIQQKETESKSEIFKEHMPSDEQKSQVDDKEEVLRHHVCNKITERIESGVSETKQHGQVVDAAAGSSTPLRNSLEPVHNSKVIDEASKLGELNSSQAKHDSSSSSGQIVSRPPKGSENKSPSTTTYKQPKLKVSTSASAKKDTASTTSSTEESVCPKHSLKSHPKGPDHPRSKSSHNSRISHGTGSKPTLSGSKEQLIRSFSKASPTGSGETTGSQSQNASSQIKLVNSGSCQKNEKMNQSIAQQPSKLLNYVTALHPPASTNAASTLSDEELALLLHQELNSSPRVPRVPRMRQATAMQLASQTASMLSKRSSHTGGKDQVSRRKNKEETSRDGHRNSYKSVDETKRPDRKYRESVMTDGSAKKDSRNKSPDNALSLKKNISSASTEGENCCQPSSEAGGQNAFSTRSSPRDGPDVNTSLTHRTLPGLVDEILSKVKCSTYEELCDAVHPYWHNLRKPNGERYAYSSHSHAVLDCLRNRSEWAHLIDRGPKTNSSRRKRKLDSETSPMEESENDEAKTKTSTREVEDRNGDSHQEDFPKGKRKARKRRQLKLQGRSVGEGRKRKHSTSQGSALVSDDDDNDDDDEDSSSKDGGDGALSDGESQERGCATGAEVSTSTSSGGSD